MASRDLAYVADKPWRIGEIARLAIPVVKARENTQHFEVALHAHPFPVAIKNGEIGVDRQIGATSPVPISPHPIEHALFLPTEECILEQGEDIIGDRTIDRILEIEYPGDRLAHHQVARHVVTVHEYARLPQIILDDAFEYGSQGGGR